MFNFFEQPWTLLGAAVLTLFGVFTYRSVLPEKSHWWQWLLPSFVAILAFGVDILIKTDLERVNAVVKTAIQAVEDENTDAIQAIIAENYRDSYHPNKASLVAHFREELSEDLVAKNTKSASLVQLSPPKATVTLFLLTTFNRSSYVARNYKPLLYIEADLYLEKQPDKNWLISRIEVREIDRQPVSWKRVH